jgi:hypothetical protein
MAPWLLVATAVSASLAAQLGMWLRRGHPASALARLRGLADELGMQVEEASRLKLDGLWRGRRAQLIASPDVRGLAEVRLKGRAAPSWLRLRSRGVGDDALTAGGRP